MCEAHLAERDHVLARYTELRRILESPLSDSEKKRSVLAPGGSPSGRALEMLTNFAQPITPRRSVSLWRDHANVAPATSWRIGPFSNGNSIDMVKKEGEWYFTGHVSID